MAQRSKFLCRSKAQRNFGHRKRRGAARTVGFPSLASKLSSQKAAELFFMQFFKKIKIFLYASSEIYFLLSAASKATTSIGISTS